MRLLLRGTTPDATFDDTPTPLGPTVTITRGVLWAPTGLPPTLPVTGPATTPADASGVGETATSPANASGPGANGAGAGGSGGAGGGVVLAVIGGPHREAARGVARLRASGVLAAEARVALLPGRAAAGPLLLDSWGATLAADSLEVAPGAPPPSHRTLLIGGSGSGKSGLAEDLLLAEPDVLYLATGPAPGPDDAEWAARVAAHRDRRPPGWRTRETLDAAAVLAAEPAPVLLDAVGTWLTGTLDRCGAWTAAPGWRTALDAAVDDLVSAWAARPGRLVAVTDEVGSGVVPETPAGRLFRTELGRLNQRLAAASDDVHLVVAGRTLPLTSPWPRP